MKKIAPQIGLLLVINYLSCFSQPFERKKNLFFEGNLHYGFVTPHTQYISYFITDHVKGYQFQMGIQTLGEKNWHQHYNYPRIGIGFYHSGLGNDQIFGNISALYGFVERNFLQGNPRFNIGNDINFGISLISKHYNIYTNPYDEAIGSKLNVYINYTINSTYQINGKTQLKIGLGVMHASNGNYQEPNKGINLFTAFGGVRYSFRQIPSEEYIRSDEQSHTSKNNFLVMGAFGRKQVSEQFKEKYTPGALSVEYSREITSSGLLGCSFNFYHDPTLKRLIDIENASDTTINSLRISGNLSYELKMGRISYVLQPGIYLKNPYPKSGKINNRVSLRYQITPKWVAGITIKAHWTAIADFIEWGIGYRWKY